MTRLSKQKINAYHREFADDIITQMESCMAPWQRPWEAGLPRNFASNKQYRGGNLLWLMHRAVSDGYDDPRWGTYLQINAAGGRVKKGERGTPVLFVNVVPRLAAAFSGGQEKALDELLDERSRRTGLFWTEHRVFNVAQTTGLRLSAFRKRQPWRAHQRAERVLSRSGVTIHHRPQPDATYSWRYDLIEMPPRSTFPAAAGYYRTLMHELGHATGHPSRLNRKLMRPGAKRVSATYAREELRAEIGSMMVNCRLGIKHEPMHGTAYVKSWVALLKDKPKEIHRAAADAQKMADYLLGAAPAAEAA